jgi:predicted dehydrogenase
MRLIIRLKGQAPIKKAYSNLEDSLLLELQDFVDAVQGKKEFHVSFSEMIATVDAFERIVRMR